MCACAEQIFLDLHYLRRQKIYSIFIEIKKKVFFARYTLISHKLESYSYRPENVNVLPLNSKILGGLLLRFFFHFFQYMFSSRRCIQCLLCQSSFHRFASFKIMVIFGG